MGLFDKNSATFAVKKLTCLLKKSFPTVSFAPTVSTS